MEDVRVKEGWKDNDRVKCRKCGAVVRYVNGIWFAQPGDQICRATCYDAVALQEANEKAIEAKDTDKKELFAIYWSRFTKIQP